LAQLALLALLAHKVSLAVKAQLDYQEPQVLMEVQAPQACLDQLGHKVSRASKELQVYRALLVLTVL
jgi:hypothetical protein